MLKRTLLPWAALIGALALAGCGTAAEAPPTPTDAADIEESPGDAGADVSSCDPSACGDAGPCREMQCVEGACVETATPGAACDDGDPCTVEDVCEASGCVGGKTRTCDSAASGPCTERVCDPKQGRPEDGWCIDAPVSDGPFAGPCESYECKSGAVAGTPTPIHACDSLALTTCVDAWTCKPGHLNPGHAGDPARRHCAPVFRPDGARCALPSGVGVKKSGAAATPSKPSSCSYYVCYGAATESQCTLSDDLSAEVRASLEAQGAALGKDCVSADAEVSPECSEWRCDCLTPQCAEAACTYKTIAPQLGEPCDGDDLCDGSVCALDAYKRSDCLPTPDFVQACDVFPAATCDIAVCDPDAGCPATLDPKSHATCASYNPCADPVNTFCSPNDPGADPATGCVLSFKPAGASCALDPTDTCIESATCQVINDSVKCIAQEFQCPQKPCLKSLCKSSKCEYLPLPGGDCEDGDPCTAGDTCQDGLCVGGTSTCECKKDADCAGSGVEAVPCRKVACVGFKCLSVPDAKVEGAACDDGSPCTQGATCGDGECKGGKPVACPVDDPYGCAVALCDPAAGGCATALAPAGTGCSDADPCTTGDVCDANGACSGVLVDCSQFGDACNVATCLAGACAVTPTVGVSCDDGEVCTPATTCDASGDCSGPWDAGIEGCTCHDDAECEDDLGCTLNECTAEGECIVTVKAGSCLIGAECIAAAAVNVKNACQVCVPEKSGTGWSSKACDDGSSCTDDACDPATGCVAIADDTNPCSDGDPCSSDDHCVGGACVGTCECTVDADCSDPPPPCKRLVCSAYACAAVPDASKDGAGCDDGLFCTTKDACQAGTCAGGPPLDCSVQATGDCIQGVCDESLDACVPELIGDGTSCDDKDPCTLADACDDGVCQGTSVDCSSKADACNLSSCTGGVCVATPKTGAACDDGEKCTASDKCTSFGSCEGTWDQVACGCDTDAYCASLTDACNTGTCDVGTHQCTKAPKTGASCNDGSACTHTDACSDKGLCAGVPAPCDDGKSCTSDVCDGEGGCTFPLKSATCLIAAKCYAAGEKNPANPCEVCVGGGAWAASGPAACNDGVACTKADTCAAGTCKGAPYTCAHLPECQSAACISDGCQVTTSPSHCVIGGACIPSGAANPTNACESCLPQKSQTGWSANASACDDGDACSKSDLCAGGACKGTPYFCDDGKACTDDVCDGKGGCQVKVVPGKCLVETKCWSQGEQKPGNACLSCQTGVSPVKWTPTSQGSPCNDGLPCTDGDACDGGGACAGSVAACETKPCEVATCTASGCDIAIKPGWCRIDGACYKDQDKDAPLGCRRCDAATSQTAFAMLSGVACDDASACTKGDTCQAGSCAGTVYSCDDGKSCTADTCDGKGGCGNSLASGYCLIAGVCVVDGDPNPANECQRCQASVTTGAWSPRTGACTDDGKPCTVDACASGQCQHTYSGTPDACFIDGACVDKGAENPANPCQMCYGGTQAWMGTPSGTPCPDDGKACTPDRCDGSGVCVHEPYCASDVVAGYRSTCILYPALGVSCFGESPPAGVPGAFTDISGYSHDVCALDASGAIACRSGGLHAGQVPTLPPAGVFAQTTAGESHSCAIKASDKSVVCWATVSGPSPAAPPAGPFAWVSAGSDFTCGVRADKTLACWGSDAGGKATPPNGSFAQVAAGGDHACAIGVDKKVTCWGSDAKGQKGVPAGLEASAIAAGRYHSCALTTAGDIRCWGIADGSEDDDGQSADAPGGTAYVTVDAGYWHSCGVRADQTVRCWGRSMAVNADKSFEWVNHEALRLERVKKQACGVTPAGALASTGSQTVEAWVKLDNEDTGYLHSLVARWYGGTATWILNVQTNKSPAPDFFKFTVMLSDGTVKQITVSVDSGPGVWRHVAGVFDGAGKTIRVVVDGTKVGSASVGLSALKSSTVPLVIGNYSQLPPQYDTDNLDGTLDEVRVWNVARSTADIKQTMMQDLTGSEVGLVGYWRLDGNGADGTSLGNDLTCHNGPVYVDDAPF